MFFGLRERSQARPSGTFSNKMGTCLCGGHDLPSEWNGVNVITGSKWEQFPQCLHIFRRAWQQAMALVLP